MRYPPYIEQNLTFPPFYLLRRSVPESAAVDLPRAVSRAMDDLLSQSPIRAGQTVALAVGSRGIRHLPQMVGLVIERLKQHGARPLLVPAMGSHGGATADGQIQLLAGLGVKASALGIPVDANMSATEIGRTPDGVPVHFSDTALGQDHTICINRIKPHTKFKGTLESGLAKMLVVGLGKHEGALVYHRWAMTLGFEKLLADMADVALSRSNFRGGLAIVENASHDTLCVEALPAGTLLRQEPELLQTAMAHFPHLPVKDLDVLIVEQIGKDISGAGMDPNVTGRAYDLMESDFSSRLTARRLAILNLTPKTRGNGLGLGNADIITEKVYRQLDYETTVMNALTSLSLRKAFIPVRLPDDRRAIRACYRTLGPIAVEDVKAVIIRDTGHINTFWASASLKRQLVAKKGLTIIEKVPTLPFDDRGNLTLPWAGMQPSSG